MVAAVIIVYLLMLVATTVFAVREVSLYRRFRRVRVITKRPVRAGVCLRCGAFAVRRLAPHVSRCDDCGCLSLSSAAAAR